MEEEQRNRLGDAIKRRRRRMGLSVRRAALAAGIDRATWTSAEEATRTLQPQNYPKIERALAWEHGSVDSILAGGEPAVIATVVDVPAQRRPVNPDDLIINAILHSTLPDERKLELVALALDDMADKRQAAAERMDEWRKHQGRAAG